MCLLAAAIWHLHVGELAQPSEALFAAAPAFSIIEAFCKSIILERNASIIEEKQKFRMERLCCCEMKWEIK